MVDQLPAPPVPADEGITVALPPALKTAIVDHALEGLLSEREAEDLIQFYELVNA